MEDRRQRHVAEVFRACEVGERFGSVPPAERAVGLQEERLVALVSSSTLRIPERGAPSSEER
jgi:hypothetical protein